VIFPQLGKRKSVVPKQDAKPAEEDSKEPIKNNKPEPVEVPKVAPKPIVVENEPVEDQGHREYPSLKTLSSERLLIAQIS
jgi:hypothetical protein